ncbi:Inner membrane ALBINO3-like protein 2, chloroplastic Flags: Precursor [Monoraphidium neglectum]|uniref:Membrane insertase YidC/Oxa/ALB C-terminal domain-containing protein n=1 Tax=Monoraphidium neglectum TaxID=145388 RepID=A0A0D2L906_9CHLO|nr:Inner membrane ALBINO3-like protein 2, chloroplastic Flags: Precursor [Monoraphidium neglectum]KIZ03324.1 Inner membrane ALBINO3-like protein 2, chloroplastic Flags: Precursor [Monoraphidium neglectum]|eukprot:XP_013902343.1 Inner membrane ALBINO3-like protein 2, chloroplastic Flags: Precursor [Monoraphidium neglectum]
MASLLATRAPAAAGALLRGPNRRGVVQPLVRRGPVRVRALFSGAEHEAVTHLATSAHSALLGATSALYVLADTAASAASAAAPAASAAAAAAPADDGGIFGFLTVGFEKILEVLDAGLEGANVPYSYGFAIILLTLLVKLATFPLSQKSMQSTAAMQALQPRVKELQARYANEPEQLQVAAGASPGRAHLETARLYREAGVNPLAGCLPTLATIPVFIGLYKALTKAADDGLLTSGFFWIPSLGGPTTLEMRQEGSGLSWLFPFVDGAPPIGWHDAGAYLILPVLLVISQWASQKIVSPKTDDPAQQQTQAILQFIPFMIGWFSLNVPSGLTLYWFVNNIISTAQQVYMKKTIKVDLPAAVGATGPIIDVSGTPILPKEEREKTVTGRELGARKKKGSPEPDAAAAALAAQQQQQQGKRKGSKFAARKAKEAAGKAAAAAAASGQQQQQQQPAQQAQSVAVEVVDAPSVPDAPPSKN